MKKLFVNTKSTSSSELEHIARKCDFRVVQGKKHTKIETTDGVFITTVPRHAKIKREVAKEIVKRMNEHGAGIEYI
ncbi:hypothetical protein A2755_03275 [Candidatus Wolfebacteria bacterium RIFCSPHIGHO2_01_FULL_48_22]|uniref:Addiction module toxin, HicA family n=2 Tax=Candidatus Wolfeibacteriota TaxID=1752735 RepID=A0A1F8DPK5_9BACT|nr:MAG: hypothetical protein A2755_03275 [Candidatus Wolfebacteria bacterium RIFCSPHIGHO2_01_FULL_48_22]OGM92051.1 MAG: hypothetical protein A2935_01765 [Candidatus Wolfebacteria bacterium RIFCSPLOWO2_01_FULL_47_17b]